MIPIIVLKIKSPITHIETHTYRHKDLRGSAKLSTSSGGASDSLFSEKDLRITHIVCHSLTSGMVVAEQPPSPSHSV